MAAAKNPGGTEVALLVDYFVDPELLFLRNQYAANARDGLVTVGNLDLGQPRVESENNTQATIVTCEINSLQLLFKATGKPFPGKAGDATPTPNGVRSTMVLTPSGQWKISNTTGVDGSCAGF